MLTSRQIRSTITRYNISAYGISAPVLDKRYTDQYRKWLEQGYHAEMGWMNRTKDDRLDIRNRFPWVKSVLVVLDNYYSDLLVAGNGIRFSRYAMGRDYHDVVQEKLAMAFRVFQEINRGIEGKIYIDTGPLLEKAFAEQAGLGWIGKNGMFIGKGIGSFCFIGILLLSEEAEPGKKAENRCGSCNRCIEHCPTGAIVEPGLIDSNRCISYLTIEKKGDFSNREATLLNNWVYGCDVCQDVCPWNRKWAQITSEPRYYERRDAVRDYIELGNNGNMNKFTSVFENTPVERLRFNRMKRNLMAVIQNQQ